LQAVLEREQAREQLENLQRRFDDSVAKMQQQTAQECDLVRRETQTARQQLEVQVWLRNFRITGWPMKTFPVQMIMV